MAAKGYTNEVNIENYLLKAIDPSFSTQLDTWISAMEREIDKITGRNFIADGTATARLFGGTDERILLIDDATEITKVEIGQDMYGSTFVEIGNTGSDRYFTEPGNHTVNGVPITKLTLSARIFGGGTQNHRITAKWGYSATVPDDIKMACTVFVAGIINSQSATSGSTVKSERIGNYQVTYSESNDSRSFADFRQAMDALDTYKRYYI